MRWEQQVEAVCQLVYGIFEPDMLDALLSDPAVPISESAKAYACVRDCTHDITINQANVYKQRK